VALAGCATNSQNQQHADGSMLLKSERDYYLAQAQSDPLGAYLANREQSYAHGASVKSTSALASTALSVLGIKYRYGGETPDTGFDCSGLVTYAAEKSLGLKLPRRSADLARLGTSVKRNELKKG